MRLSIRLKVLLAVSVSLILMFVLIAFLLARHNISNLRSNLNEQSESFATLSAKPIGDNFTLYKDSGSLRIDQQINDFLEMDPDVTSIRIVSVDGKQVYDSKNRDNPPIDEKLASSFEPQYLYDSSGYIEQIVQPYFEDSGARRYSIVYEISTQRVEQNVRDIVQLIIYVGLAILLISIGLTGIMLNSFFIRPLRAVSHSANIISSGDYDHKITAKQQDEIGDLAQSVEKMANHLKSDIIKLRDLDKLKSEFMMITSHNLRTPIAVIQGYTDIAQSTKDIDELKSILTTIKENIIRLHMLSEDMLTIATLEAGNFELSKAPVNLNSFLQPIASEFSVLATEKKIGWIFENNTPEDLEIELGKSSMRSALANLIDNAIKFTESGGTVSVKVGLTAQHLTFEVRDSGIGISSEEIPKLFTKFHRGTSTMTYDYEGIGIGLYLTKLVVEQHGGKIDVQSIVGQGSVFTVYLPLATETNEQLPASPVDPRESSNPTSGS